MATAKRQQIANTITYLKRCQTCRANGGEVSYITDATWLVQMAINRRAGWPDDPTALRGSAMPVNGQYPAKAAGQSWIDLRHLACKVNTPRLIVRVHEVPLRYRQQLSRRIFSED